MGKTDREAERGGKVSEKYDVIYSDPPWFYGLRIRRHSYQQVSRHWFGGGASGQYPLMKDEELLSLAAEVNNLAETDAALFLWATCPRLDFCLEFLKQCGFRYSTVAFSWIKLSSEGKPLAGPGFYTGSNLEIVLLGVRGSMKPAVSLTPSVVFSPRLGHSRKPDEVRRRIEAMYPNARRLEMFARPISPLWPKIDGWQYWGNEITSDVVFDPPPPQPRGIEGER